MNQNSMRNKDSTANIESEGVGDIDPLTLNGEPIKLENVICAYAVAEILLSLRKFVDERLSVYLDYKIITTLSLFYIKEKVCAMVHRRLLFFIAWKNLKEFFIFKTFIQYLYAN